MSRPFCTKTITRKNLIELAKIMPVLSEKEQRQKVGAAFYYDPSGVFLGEFGDTNETRIVSVPSYDCPSYYINDNTEFQTLSQASETTILAVENTMAENYGYTGSVGLNIKDPKKAGSFHPEDGIQFNLSGYLFYSNNHYDFLSVLDHEINHEDTQHDSGSQMSEYEALHAQIISPTFEHTSDHFKQQVLEQYNKLLNELHME